MSLHNKRCASQSSERSWRLRTLGAPGVVDGTLAKPARRRWSSRRRRLVTDVWARYGRRQSPSKVVNTL